MGHTLGWWLDSTLPLHPLWVLDVLGVSVDGQRRVGRPEGFLGELVAAVAAFFLIMCYVVKIDI